MNPGAAPPLNYRQQPSPPMPASRNTAWPDVFVNLSSGPLNSSAWRRTRWASACRAATLEGLRFHDLRSVAESALVAAGVDVETAQRRLGHANVTMTLQV